MSEPNGTDPNALAGLSTRQLRFIHKNRLTKLEQVAGTENAVTQQIGRQKRELQFSKNNLAWIEQGSEEC